MPGQPSSPPKPVSEIWRPELTRLPRLHWRRRGFRYFSRWLCKLVVTICTKSSVEGLENFPESGPALVVINHLGDADGPLLVASIPLAPDALGKIELYSLRFWGKLLEWYGIIWVHRGQPDRRAVRAALEGFAEGRILVVAPEGRYSLIGGLEEGTHGAAFLASKADVPIVPIVVVGTENDHIYGRLKRFQRAPVCLKVGPVFKLKQHGDRRERMQEGTNQIMNSLAELLPVSYRGAYRSEKKPDRKL